MRRNVGGTTPFPGAVPSVARQRRGFGPPFFPPRRAGIAAAGAGALAFGATGGKPGALGVVRTTSTARPARYSGITVAQPFFFA